MPLVPTEILQAPFPTVPVPIAAAALSPAPATTFTPIGNPISSATSFFYSPMISKLS